MKTDAKSRVKFRVLSTCLVLATRNGDRQALAQLSADQRACVALFYLEDMRVAEVAVALDVPAGTVKTRMMHARKKLRAILEGESDGQTGQAD